MGTTQRHCEPAHLALFLELNLQECINSTTGVVVALEVQPEPHQVLALSMGLILLPQVHTLVDTHAHTHAQTLT